MFNKVPSPDQILEENASKTYMSYVSDVHSALRTLVLCDRQGNFKAFAVVRHPERATSSSQWPITMIGCSTATGREMLNVFVGDGVSLENNVCVVAAMNGDVVPSTKVCYDMFASYDRNRLEQKKCAVADLVRFAEANRGGNPQALSERAASLISRGLLEKTEAIKSFREYTSDGPYSPNDQLTPRQQDRQMGEYQYYLERRLRHLKKIFKIGEE